MSVSFVIPVYNKEEHLPHVLAAIAAQKGNFDREFIFVDDGSTDQSLALLKSLTADWQNCKIIEQPNQGSAVATNTGIFAATKTYIKFVDADDLLHHQATEILLDALTAHPDASLAYCPTQNFDFGDVINLEAPLKAPQAKIIPESLRAWIRNTMFNPTQFIARTADVQSVGGCDIRTRGSQEYGLVLRLARLGDFLFMDAPLAFYCRPTDQRHGASNNRQLQRVNLLLASFLEDCPDIPPKLQHYAYRRAIGRAWKFARRNRGQNFTSPFFWKNLISRIATQNNYAAAIRRTLPAFD